MSESERASAPAGVNICFRNLNNRPPVICISDNGQPYGSVDPRCAEVLFLSSHPCLSLVGFLLTSLISFNSVLILLLYFVFHLLPIWAHFVLLQTSFLSVCHP